MTNRICACGIAATCLLWSSVATAQTASPQSPQPQASEPAPSTTPTPTETRPATTTFYGDTGLWFVPTAEIVPHGKVSVSGYRRGTNYIEGYTNVGDFAGTFAFGIKDRLELFRPTGASSRAIPA